MRLVTFVGEGYLEQAGALVEGGNDGFDCVVPLGAALHHAGIETNPKGVSLLQVLDHWEQGQAALRIAIRDAPPEIQLPLSGCSLRAPLPRPRSFRDFYAFEEHVRNARARRGLEIAKEWYQQPAFYFSNPQAFVGPDDVIPFPRDPAGHDSIGLDYELEVAWTVSRPLRNPTPAEAWEAIAGLMILNDWSARDWQRAEMAVGLGPSKAKDFATSLGPWFVPTSELDGCARGTGYGLKMQARVNGELLSEGNLSDAHYSLGAMTAHAARNTTLLPGEILGTGTVGTGCLLELGRQDGDYLQPGDVVELEVERLGILRNVVADR